MWRLHSQRRWESEGPNHPEHTWQWRNERIWEEVLAEIVDIHDSAQSPQLNEPKDTP